MAAATKTAIDPEALAALIEQQEQRCRSDLDAALIDARAGQAMPVVERLTRMAEFIAESALPGPRREAIKAEAMEIQRDAYRKQCDRLLDEAMAHSRSGDTAARAQVLMGAQETLGKALALGLDAEFKVSFAKKLNVLMMTQPAGTSEKAGIDKHHDWESNTGAEYRSGEKGKRRHLRFKDPVLLVSTGRAEFRTRDWALGGLRVACAAGDFRQGQQLTISFRAETMPETSYQGRVEVCRLMEEAAAMRFLSLDNPIIRLVKTLRRARLDPC